MKMYISGPISGIPDLNRAAFDSAEKTLRWLGHETVNPLKINNPEDTWEQCMRRDIAALRECEGIYMLKGWEKSEGAWIERHIGSWMGIPIYFEEDLS